jgi:hypothetical protein
MKFNATVVNFIITAKEEWNFSFFILMAKKSENWEMVYLR